MMKLKNKTLLVCGGGKSGRAMAGFLLSKGAKVIVSDTRKIKIQGVECIGQEDITGRLADIDMMILSPGIDPKKNFVLEALRKKIPVAGEFELAYSFVPEYVKRILITGTNGKSTVTSLTAHILSSAGKHAIAGGNIGTPITALLKKFKKNSALVAEVSSYNLERHLSRKALEADVGILLNIASDHLSRYRNMAEYAGVKRRVFAGLKRGGIGINGTDRPGGSAILRLGKDMYFRSGSICFSRKALKKFPRIEPIVLEKEKMKLLFEANRANILAAAGAAMAMGLRPEDIQKGLYSFRPLANRLEYAGSYHGRRFINDSKATNVSSVLFALKNLKTGIVLIMGGRDKGSSYRALRGYMKNVKTLVAYGEAGLKIEGALKGAAKIVRREKFTDACSEALKKSAEGDTILLSPGCSSFDQFKNFEERGKAFKKWLKNLT